MQLQLAKKSNSEGVAFKKQMGKCCPEVKLNQLDFISTAGKKHCNDFYIFICVCVSVKRLKIEETAQCSLQPQPQAWRCTDTSGICADLGARAERVKTDKKRNGERRRRTDKNSRTGRLENNAVERENRKAEIQDEREKRKSESKKGAGEIRSCRLLCV